MCAVANDDSLYKAGEMEVIPILFISKVEMTRPNHGKEMMGDNALVSNNANTCCASRLVVCVCFCASAG